LTVPAFTGADPIGQFYPTDRPWRIPVTMDTPRTQEYFEKRIDELIPYYKSTGVTDLLVEQGDSPRLKILWRHIERDNDHFRPVAGGGPVRLVRFNGD